MAVGNQEFQHWRFDFDGKGDPKAFIEKKLAELRRDGWQISYFNEFSPQAAHVDHLYWEVGGTRFRKK